LDHDFDRDREYRGNDFDLERLLLLSIGGVLDEGDFENFLGGDFENFLGGDFENFLAGDLDLFREESDGLL